MFVTESALRVQRVAESYSAQESGGVFHLKMA